MRFGKKVIGLMTVIFLGLILVAATQNQTEETVNIPLSFEVKTDGNRERISCWKNDEGEYFVFLPGYAQMDTVYILTQKGESWIGETLLTEGMSCGSFSLDTAYPFFLVENGQTLESTLTFIRSDGIPSVYIDVQSGSMDYIHMDKTNEESGNMRLYAENGTMLFSGELSRMTGRGNTSWDAEKKPYNLTLSQETDLLGMGAAQNWVLLAEGYNSLNIRNKIVYDFAGAAGMAYSPDCEWVDLYLNGEYAGLYLLSERNEVHRERVDISSDDSFLISMEDERDLEGRKIPYVTVGSSQVLRIRYSSMEQQEMTRKWLLLKNALLSKEDVDPETGKHWLEMIDLDSWAMKYLIEEVFANQDGGAVSQFFYYDGTSGAGKIYAGPVWDYDYAMGGESDWMGSYRSYYTMAREYSDDGIYMPWFYELYRKPVFYDRVAELFELRILPLLEELIQFRIDEYVDLISQAAVLDQVRWGFPEDTMETEILFLKKFLTDRADFLSDLWINGTVYHTVAVYPGRYYTGFFAVRDGETLPTLPSYEDIGGIGWFCADTDEPFDISQPIYEDAHIYVKELETALPMIHYIPAVSGAVLAVLLAAFDRIRSQKDGRLKHDKTN